MIKILLFFLILMEFSITKSDTSPLPFKQSEKIYIYENNSKYCENIKKTFNKFDINYELTNSFTPATDNLYVIFDLFNIDAKNLPKHYIAYQTLDLNNVQLTNDYLNKLSNAIAVWDYNQNNINKYNSKIFNYYYCPENYEFIDMVILPCLLPNFALKTYREILHYSNVKNTDISSHLPTIFCYTVLQKPNVIIESGICRGESSFAFSKTLNFYDTKLIGIDYEPLFAAKVYSSIPNATFLCMNDLDFPKYYKNSTLKTIDIIFIDTSHWHDHTIAEIKQFCPMLTENGMLIFHDSNICPLFGGSGYGRLNGTIEKANAGHSRGVTTGLKEHFSLEFDESKYFNTHFMKDGVSWQLIHYPFCNGLAILKKIKVAEPK